VLNIRIVTLRFFAVIPVNRLFFLLWCLLVIIFDAWAFDYHGRSSIVIGGVSLPPRSPSWDDPHTPTSAAIVTASSVAVAAAIRSVCIACQR
jgi:hypothetical protein